MNHHHHDSVHEHGAHAGASSLNRMALSATLHCLTGCSIGEVLGMVIGTWFQWGNGALCRLSGEPLAHRAWSRARRGARLPWQLPVKHA